jgi:hypothetical protein
MEDKLFRERLSELAELKLRKTYTTSEPERVFRQGHEHELSEQHNPTHLLEIKQIKHQERPCEYCDRVVVNQRITQTLNRWPQPHWRRSCSTCGLTQNPNTGQFELRGNGIANQFVSMFKNKK